jgi:GNAT superfamily N-acetyltransferase
MPANLRVRDAVKGDADAIRHVATEAWRDTYAGLLLPDTIESFLDAAYSIGSVERRIADDTVLVAELDGVVVSFADATPDEGRMNLAAIYAAPGFRGRGTGTALLNIVRSRSPQLPISADVLDGNRKGEVFYERRGFVPRERLEGALFGERIVERRWWLEPPSD